MKSVKGNIKEQVENYAVYNELKTKYKALQEKLKELELAKDNNEAICKEYEHKLNESLNKNEQLSRLITQANNSVIFINTDKVIYDCNPAVLKLLEIKEKSDLIGQSIANFIEISINLKSFKQNKAHLNKVLLKTASGKQKHTEIQIINIEEKQQDYAIIIKDVTKKIQSQENTEKQLQLLANIEALNTQIGKSLTSNELTRNICKHFSFSLECSSVYLYELFSSNKKPFVRSVFRNSNDEQGTQEFSDKISQSELLNFINYTHSFSPKLISLSPLTHRIPKNREPELQVLVFLNVSKNKDVFICINFNNKSEYHEYALSLLKQTHYQIKLAYGKLEIVENLRTNEYRYRALTEHAHDIVLISDKYGKYKYVSPSITRYNITPEQILNKTAHNFIEPEDIPLIKEATQYILDEPEKSTRLYSIRINWDNKSYIVDIVLKNLLYLKGINGIVINIQDNTDRIEVLKQIHESEEKYSALVENANDGIVLIKNNKIVYSNQKLNQLLEINGNEILGKSPLDFSPEFQENGKSSDALFHEIIYTTLDSGKQIFEWNFISLKGRSFEGHIALSKIVLVDGINFLAIIRDISDIKQAHRKIQESEDRLNNIFESMADGVYLCSMDRKVVYANKAMRDMVDADLEGKSCFNSIFGFTNKCEWCKGNFLSKQSKQLIEVQNPLNNKHYQIIKTIISNGDSEKFILHISRDVTDIIEAQQHIQESEKKFRNIFNNSNDAVFITDLKGKYLEVNKLYAERLGLKQTDIIGKHFESIIPKISSKKLSNHINAILKEGCAIEEFKVSLQGVDRVVEINSKVIEYQGSQAVLHVSRDITLRKKLERDILESTIATEEKERSRFAQDLHDGIGPYLSATKFFLNTISRENDEQERNIIIDKAKDSIDEIISNVKEISNNISPHVLKNFGIIAALNSFKKKTIHKEIRIHINSNIEGKRFAVNIENSLFKIIIELINNTFKYAKANTITIEILKNENELSLFFEHDGLGFDYKQISKSNKGMGLQNITTRIKSLDGEYKFITSPETNFKFIAHLNLL